MRRPHTLRETSERIATGCEPVKEISEFLDVFYDCASKEDMVACLEEEPVLLPVKMLNAYFGAAAEYLSKRYQLPELPVWISNKARYLDEPWFVNDEVREYLTWASPAEFRTRNIFTEEAPLRRARTWKAEERFWGSHPTPAK